MVYGITRNGKFRTYVSARSARTGLDEYLQDNSYVISVSSESYFEVQNIKSGLVFEYAVEPRTAFDVTLEGSHAGVV